MGEICALLTLSRNLGENIDAQVSCCCFCGCRDRGCGAWPTRRGDDDGRAVGARRRECRRNPESDRGVRHQRLRARPRLGSEEKEPSMKSSCGGRCRRRNKTSSVSFPALDIQRFSSPAKAGDPVITEFQIGHRIGFADRVVFAGCRECVADDLCGIGARS